MIDIHSHIVFDVDDGPKTLEDSIALLKEAYSQGVRTVVSTSHRRKGMFETPEEKILANFLMVKEAMSSIHPDMTLLYGGELFYTNDIPQKLETGVFPTINGTRYVLVEFSSLTPWKDIHSALRNLLQQGVTPIVAHIERYSALEFNKERVQEIINLGCYTQVNSSSVLKPKLFGDKYKVLKKKAAYFLKENMVYFIASDMHNLDNRQSYMREAYQKIETEFGKARARELFVENPQAILANQSI